MKDREKKKPADPNAKYRVMLFGGLYLVALVGVMLYLRGGATSPEMVVEAVARFLGSGPVVGLTVLVSVGYFGGGKLMEMRKEAAKKEKERMEIRMRLEQKEQAKLDKYGKRSDAAKLKMELEEEDLRKAAEVAEKLEKSKRGYEQQEEERRRKERQERLAAEERARREVEERLKELKNQQQEKDELMRRAIEAGNSYHDVPAWSSEQQRQLELALKEVGPEGESVTAKWKRIGSQVEGKTAKECLERFKELREAILEKKKQEEQDYWDAVGMMGAKGPAAMMNVSDGDGSSTSSYEDSEEEEEEDEDDEEPVERMQPELNPVPSGTQLSLNSGELVNVGAMLPEVVQLGVCCLRCGTHAMLEVSGAVEDLSQQKMWCTKCKSVIGATLRPCFAHAGSDALGHIDTQDCSISDILKLQVYVNCGACGNGHVFETPVTRGRHCQSTCVACHEKMSFFCTQFGIRVIDAPHLTGGVAGAANRKAGGGDSFDADLAAYRKKHRGDHNGIVEGHPLPNNGSCQHFKKSYRWFRFQCCGRALPCVLCHDSTDCPAANMGIFCNRILCGKCSREQEYTTKGCKFCGYDMGQGSKSQHWHGGSGLRNRAALSSKDSRKIDPRRAPDQTKTKSKKSQRVGEAGKKTSAKTQ